MVPRIRWLTVTATLAVALGLVVAACGGGAEPTSTPRPAPTPTATTAPPTATPPAGATAAPTTAAPAPTAVVVQPTATPPPTFAPPTPTAAPKPVRGGTITIRPYAELATQDPTKIYSPVTFYIMGHIFSNIIRFQNKKFSDTDITGDLADSWSLSSDGKTYTFKINPEARWQNIAPMNGRPLTAADIKWTWELLADPAYGSGYRSRWPSNVASIEAPDARTLVVRLTQPSAPFLLQLANPVPKIVAREVYEKDGSFEKTVIGSSAFVFDRFEPSVRVVTKANPNYWKKGLDGKPLPYIDEVTYLFIPDPFTVLAAFKAGKLPYLGLSADQAEQFRNTPGIAINRDFGLYTYLVRIHNGKKPFDDVRVRKAVFKAIDQEAMAKQVYREADTPLSGIVAAGIKGFELPQSELKQLLKADPAESKRLLAQAGFPNGLEAELSLHLAPLTGAINEARWAFIVQSLNAAGFKIKEYIPPGSAAGYAYTYGEKYTLNVGTLSLDASAWAYLRPSWHSQGSINIYGIKDPVLDQTIEDAETELDVAKQHQRVQDIQRYIIEKAYTLPLPLGWTYVAQWNWVKNYNLLWTWGNPGIEDLWIER